MGKHLDNPLTIEGLSRRYLFHQKLITTAELQFRHHSENPAVVDSSPVEIFRQGATEIQLSKSRNDRIPPGYWIDLHNTIDDQRGNRR